MKMKRIYYLLPALLLSVGIAMAYRFAFGSNVVVKNGATYLYIPTGASFKQLSGLLYPHLQNRKSFEKIAALKNYPAHVRPGRYEIADGMSNVELVDELRSGRQSPVRLVFNRAETLKGFAARIARQLEPNKQALCNAFWEPKFLTDHRLDSETVKQILIPDTYFVYWNISATAFRDRMLSEYQKFWNAERRAQARAENLTPLQVSTLASIVQKETNNTDEMPMVAGVYLNRLRDNWKLQSNPTVIYAFKLRHGFDTLVRRVLYADLEIDSPYNTYKYAGLPPAPIGIPDKQALEAVLHAKRHGYYFMTSDPTDSGRFHFTKTFAAHKRNRLKNDAWVKKQGINR
ncbi:MAG: endolytic transglycosylase MltG [Flavobacteriales bacterium]